MTAQADSETWNKLNKSCTLYYAKIKNKGCRDGRVKIYKTVHGLNLDIVNCIKNGGVVTNVCKVSKLVPVLTKESYRLSREGM